VRLGEFKEKQFFGWELWNFYSTENGEEPNILATRVATTGNIIVSVAGAKTPHKLPAIS
jgi:hypothetical protein